MVSKGLRLSGRFDSAVKEVCQMITATQNGIYNNGVGIKYFISHFAKRQVLLPQNTAETQGEKGAEVFA